MKRILNVILLSVFLLTLKSQAQISRPISTAVPFLLISPDSRAAALGDAGVASSPDANAIYWNTAKLAFINKQMGVTASYTPWLADIIDDMGLAHAAIYKKLNKDQAVSMSLTYFDQGKINFTTQTGADNGTYQSNDFNLTAGYTRKLARDFSMGINLKYINSNPAVGSSGLTGIKPARGVAGDISFYYTDERPSVKTQEKGWKFSAGAVISNLSGKLSYKNGNGDSRSASFVPTNLKLGGMANYKINPNHQLNFLVDVNKLLVPTPPIRDANGKILKGRNPETTGVFSGIFGSFTDAPDGLKEELREFTGSLGVEYWYNDFFALRGGYFLESRYKGNRKYLTAGLGFRFMENYHVDFAYLVPTTQGSALANTWRISLIVDLNKNKVAETEVPESN